VPGTVLPTCIPRIQKGARHRSVHLRPAHRRASECRDHRDRLSQGDRQGPGSPKLSKVSDPEKVPGTVFARLALPMPSRNRALARAYFPLENTVRAP
jgi:hypothetical protein